MEADQAARRDGSGVERGVRPLAEHLRVMARYLQHAQDRVRVQAAAAELERMDAALAKYEADEGRGLSEGLGAWVRSADRLPEDGAPVLCLFADGSMEVGLCGPLVANGDWDKRIGTYWRSAEECSPSWSVTPTHWMPLPAPPESA